MNNTQGDKWLSAVPQLIEATNSSGFSSVFLKSLGSIVEFDSAVIMAYGVGPRPKVLYDSLSESYKKEFYERYLKGVFLLSPLYQTYKNNNQGFFHINDVVTDGFFVSEYHKEYYCHSGISDQVFFLKQFNDGVAVVVSIARTARYRPYSNSDMAALESIAPIVMSLLSKNWHDLANNGHTFSDYLHKAFDNFGCSILSRREKDAVNCMLKGCSTKSAAKELGISPETERSYRKSIYNKLNVSSHSEIYNLFFQTLDFADNGVDCDPLALYWSSRH